MLIEALIKKKSFFEGDVRTHIQTNSVRGGLTCHARVMKFTRKLGRYKIFTEKMSVLRCEF